MENESPSVVCIIVNWNGWADTLQCLDCLYKSAYGNLVPVLVDNGSTDDSVERIRAAYPDLEIVQSALNLGFGAGNNLAIRRAIERNAKYVWLLNNDTAVRPDTLAAMVATAEADRSLGAIGSILCYAHAPDCVQAWGGGHVNLWTGTSRHFHGPVQRERLDYLTAASVLIPTHVLRQVGLFDEGYFMYWEDTDLSFRIRRAGWKLGIAEKAVLLHKEGTSSGPKSPQFDHYVTVYGVRFLRKFAPLPVVPAFIMVFARAFRRFLSGEWARGWAVLSSLGSLARRGAFARH